ncbi:MAG: amidohydrolase family protein [Actinomycetota bacterium]|uniref:amidohydrolase family protein n=1 Tax=Brevibacterium sp. CSND-B09 TaxID=3462571 RepID=UPI003F27D16C
MNDSDDAATQTPSASQTAPTLPTANPAPGTTIGRAFEVPDTMTAPPRTDAEVPDYVRALGLPGLADIHVHFLPQNVLDKVWEYFDNASDNYGRDWPINYRYDTDTRLDIVRELGLRAVPALTYPHKPGMAAWLNEWNAEFAAAHDDVIHCGTLYAEPESADYVPAALAAGAKLFKVHVQVGVFSPDDEVLDPAWKALEEARVPIVIHAGSAPLPGTYTGPQAVANVLERFPQLKFVIAHMGMPEYDEFADLAESFDNVYLDTTMFASGYFSTPAEVTPAYRERLARLEDKVILGSDFPNIPYPYVDQISGLAALGLGDDWMRSVLWTNGAKVLGLD